MYVLLHGFEIHLVEGLELIEHLAAHFAGHAGRVVDVKDRIAFAAERDAGVLAVRDDDLDVLADACHDVPPCSWRAATGDRPNMPAPISGDRAGRRIP